MAKRGIAGSLMLLMLASTAEAHREDVSYLIAAREGETLSLVFEVSWMDLVPEGQAPPRDGEALTALGPDAHVLIEANTELYTRSGAIELPTPVSVAPSQRAGGWFVQVRYAVPAPKGALGLDVHLFDALGPAHKTVARVHTGPRPEYAVFDVRAPRFLFAAPEPAL